MAIKEYIKNSHKPENVREYYINNHPHWPGLNPYIKFTPGIHSIYVGATGEMFPASTNYKEVLAPADINNPVYLKDILCENGELLFDGDITKFYIVADPEISGRFFINGANIGNIATNQDSPNIMVLDEEAVNKYEPRRYATEHSIKKSILHANIKYTYYDVTNTLQSGTVSSGTKALNDPYPWWGTPISWQSIPAVGYEFTGAESTYKGSITAGTGDAVIEPITSPTAKSYSVYKNATNGATITVNNTGTFDSALSISIGGLKSSSWLKSASITGPETTLNYGSNSYTMTGVYYTDITVNAEGNLMNLYNAASSATGVTITYPNYGEATVIRGDSTWNTSSDKFQFKLNEGYNFPITLTIKDNSTGTDYSNFSITAADCDYNSSTGVYTLKTPSEIINTSYVENTQIYTIAATRITWSPTITLGTGVAKFQYSTNGTNWYSTEYTSGAGIVIDYADTCYVKASTASSGYVLENQSYATCTYSSQSVTVPKAAKFTVNVTRATGVATYSYSTNDGTSYTNGVTAASFTCPTGNTAKVKPYTASTNYTVDTTTVQLTATTPASITLVPATVPFYMDHRFEGTVFETTGPHSVAYNGTIEASDYIELTEFETPAYWYYNGSNTIVSGVKSEMTINIDWATRKVHTYTITWKYLSAYPSTWTTTTETYNYNATPSRTGNNVTNSADNAREYFLQWDSLSNVTSDRTITGQYKRQYKLTFSGTRCTTDTKYLSGWYDNSETAFTYTWTAGTSSDRTNYAFDSGGTQKTATQSITPNQAGIYSKSADYIYVKINSTNSTASIGGTAIDDGWRWVRYDIQCTWTATTNYAYSNSGLSTSSINLTEAGKDAYDSAPTHLAYTVKGVTRTTKTSDSTVYDLIGATISYEWTTSQTYYAFDSNGTKTASNSKILNSTGISLSVNAPGWYYYGTKPAATHTTHTTASTIGWQNTSTYTVTYTAASGYAYDATGKTTATDTANPGNNFIAQIPGYILYTTAGVARTDHPSTTTAYIEIGSSVSFKWTTSQTYYAFDSSGTRTASASATVSDLGVVLSVAEPGWYYYGTWPAATYTTHTTNTTIGWQSTSTYTVTYEAITNYAYASSGTKEAYSTANPGEDFTAKVPGYGYLTATTTHCDIVENGSGWYDLGKNIVTTYRASSDWSFGGSTLKDTTTTTTTVPNSVSASPGYCNVTINATNSKAKIGTTDVSGTTAIRALNTSITWTPNTYYSFSAGTDQTNTTATISGPGTYSKSPTNYRAASIASSSYCTPNRNTNTYYASGTTITWTAGSNYSFGGSNTGDTTTPSTTITAGASMAAPTPGYMKATYSGTNVSKIYRVVGSGIEETMVNSGIYPVGTTVYWRASTATNTQYSFTNSSATSPTTSTSEALALNKLTYTHNASYIYYNVTINKGTNTASSNYASGYLLNGTTITFTTTAATSTKRYSYSSSSSTVNTENKTVSSAGQSITSDSVYIWMNCTFTGTNCSATNGWYIVGTNVTWTGDTGTNYKYSFTNTPVRNPSDAQRQTTSTVVEDTTSYAKTASYVYYNVNIAPATNCTANYTSGWGYFLNGTTIKFTTTAATDAVRYSFSTSSSTSYEVTSQVSSSVAGGNIASGTVYIWRYCTIGAKYSSTLLASQKQWYRDSTTCSSASYYNTDSYTDPRTTSEYNKKYYYTGKTTNSITVSSSATEVYTVYSTQNKINYTVSFTKASGSYGSWTVSSISAAWDAAISRSGDTITVGSSTNTYSGYNATGYTTTVAYTNDSGTVGTANKTITATTTRTGNTYTLTSTNNHCVVKYYSDSGYANQITQARYGSTIYVTVNPDSYYYWDIKANAHGNDYTAGGYTVTGTISGSNINIGTFTASPFSYTYSATSANGVCTPGTTNALTYGSNTSMSINPNARYYYSSTSYYHGVPYTYSNRPLTTANYTFSTSTADGTATATYVSACTAITYTYSISSGNSAYCYHGKTQPSSANTTAQTGTYANRASTYVYYRINPASRYEINYNNQRGYNGSPIGDTNHYAVGSNFTFTDSNRTATLAINCTPITYTVTASLGNAGVQVGVSTNVYNTSLSKTYAELYTNNPSIYVKVTPNSHYGMTVGGTWYYNGNPLTGSSYYVKGNTFTFTDSNKTATCALSTSTYPISAIAYTASVSASNSTCTLGTASGSYSSTISLTYQSATIYLRQAPSAHYEVTYSSTRYYYGHNYTTSVNYTAFSFSDANKTATYALTGCSETTYTWTVSSTNSNYVYYNTTSNPSSAATISKKYSDNPTIYYKINANDYYYCHSTSYPKGTPYSSSVNRGSFSFSYANKTAIFKKNCTSFTYTCKPTTVTGGTVSWNPATITAGGSSSWTITANTGYNTPSTYQGSVAWANFTKSTSTANGDATASNLPNCTRKSFTITLSGPNYGAWRTSNSTSGTAVTSQTAYYGDIITSSGNTLTCYRWDATSTARWTVYAVASATTAQYSYSTPTISGTSSDPITGSKTITAANTRTTRTYTVTFTATNGSWSTTSIANVPYGTTWSTSGLTVTLSGSYGSSTYTKRATTVDYTSGDVTITSTSGTVQGATSISAVTATTARKYTIRWIGADGSTALETDSDVAYNATLTYNGSTPTKASTAQYSYTFSAWKLGSTSGSTVTSGTTKNPGSTSSTTINIYSTFTSTVRSYNVTIKKGGTTAAISSGTYQVDSGSATAISWGNAFTVKYGSYVKNVSATASASSPAISSLTAPTVAQSTGDYSGTKVRVTNNNSLQVTCYYGTSSGSTTNSTTISASSSKEITGLTAGTTYYFFFRVVKTNYSISSYDPSAASGSTGVQITGTTIITVNGSSSTQNINSSNVSCKPVAKKVPLHMEYYYEGVKLFTDTYNNYDYNSFVDTTVLLILSYKSGAYEYGDPRHNNPSQTEIDPLTTETTVVINYTTRTTAYYSITVQAKYNRNVITSQTVSKTYNSSISSTSYYGTSFDYGGYSYTGGSGQSITVTGDATIATTYSTQSYRSYTLNQGTHTNCTFSSTTGSYNTAKSLSFSPATGYGYPITYSVGTSSGGTNLKGNTQITSGTGTYTMSGTYYSTVYVNCTATAKTYNITAGTLSGVSFSATTGTYGTQKTIAISLQSSYGYPVSWSLKNGSTTVASGTLNSSTDSIKYTMNSNYYSSLSLNATATSTAFSWIPYGDYSSWGAVWDFIQDQTLGSSRAYYKVECAWVSEARTYNVNRADLDSSAASSDAFNSWLESEGYFWADTTTTRDAFIAYCTDMSDAGYFNFAFILEGGTGNDPIRIFLTK